MREDNTEMHRFQKKVEGRLDKPERIRTWVVWLVLQQRSGLITSETSCSGRRGIGIERCSA